MKKVKEIPEDNGESKGRTRFKKESKGRNRSTGEVKKNQRTKGKVKEGPEDTCALYGIVAEILFRSPTGRLQALKLFN